jgi:hypothetical protein
MPVTAFEMDERTLGMIREWQGVSGVRTNAAVLRSSSRSP